MLTKVREYFLQKGFMCFPIRESQVEVLYRLVKNGLYFVCFIDDTEDWLIEDRADRIMKYLEETLKEKYKDYTDKAEGLMIVFSGKPKETKAKLTGDFSYWIAHPLARKLMIYEDQTDSFYDVRQCMEGYWKQTPVMAMLSQLKVLFSPVNILLILANIIVFIIMSILGNTENALFMKEHGAMTAAAVLKYGRVYLLFTSMFLHFGVAHLAWNMISLLYLGRATEQIMGSVRYGILYISSGLLASLTSVIYHDLTADAICAGASGAICGVAGALAFYMLKNRKNNKNFSFVRYLIFLAIILGQGIGSSGVDNSAHIGGFIAGFILAFLMSFIPSKKKMLI